MTFAKGLRTNLTKNEKKLYSLSSHSVSASLNREVLR